MSCKYDARAKRPLCWLYDHREDRHRGDRHPGRKAAGKDSVAGQAPRNRGGTKRQAESSSNMPNVKQIAVVDRDRRVLLHTWPLEDAEGNTPLGLDEAAHRLFVGTRHPAKLVVLDTDTGKSVAKIDTNSDADDLFYDPAHRRIYVSCGEGFVDVIEQLDADHYRLIARVPTVAGARTSAFSAELNSFYLECLGAETSLPSCVYLR